MIPQSKRFCHSKGCRNAGHKRQDCDDPHRDRHLDAVGDLSHQYRTYGVSKISPKAIDPH
jgi:hypothetical protein